MSTKLERQLFLLVCEVFSVFVKEIGIFLLLRFERRVNVY